MKNFESIGIEQELITPSEKITIDELDAISTEKKYKELKMTQLKKEEFILSWLGSFQDFSEQKHFSMEIESVCSVLKMILF